MNNIEHIICDTISGHIRYCHLQKYNQITVREFIYFEANLGVVQINNQPPQLLLFKGKKLNETKLIPILHIYLVIKYIGGRNSAGCKTK